MPARLLSLGADHFSSPRWVVLPLHRQPHLALRLCPDRCLNTFSLPVCASASSLLFALSKPRCLSPALRLFRVLPITLHRHIWVICHRPGGERALPGIFSYGGLRGSHATAVPVRMGLRAPPGPHPSPVFAVARFKDFRYLQMSSSCYVLQIICISVFLSLRMNAFTQRSYLSDLNYLCECVLSTSLLSP